MKNDFIQAITATPAPENLITVYFKDGTQADYTTAILELLKTDPEVDTITSATTGEILF
jgi:hypothetical protein